MCHILATSLLIQKYGHALASGSLHIPLSEALPPKCPHNTTYSVLPLGIYSTVTLPIRPTLTSLLNMVMLPPFLISPPLPYILHGTASMLCCVYFRMLDQ